MALLATMISQVRPEGRKKIKGPKRQFSVKIFWAHTFLEPKNLGPGNYRSKREINIVQNKLGYHSN